MVPTQSETAALSAQEALQEYQAVQRAMLDQEKGIAQADKSAWQSFKDALKKIPQGIGFVGDALRVLSRSHYYLDTTLRKILEQEEKKLPATYKRTLEEVRSHLERLDKRFTQRIKNEAEPIKDSVKKQATIEAIQLEYIAALQFLARLDAPNPFGKISRDAQILLLLQLVRGSRALRAYSQKRGLIGEKKVVMPIAGMDPLQMADKIISDMINNPLFATREQFAINLVAELYNQRTINTPQGTQPLNPYQHKDAVVRSRKRGSINIEEKYTFLPARLAKVTAALRKLLGQFALENKLPTVTPGTALRIGLVFSGGGYRAMTLTAGYAEALEQLGLFDAVLYMSTLSGSTWWLAPWVLSGKSVKGFNEELAGRIDQMDVQRFARMAPKVQEAVDRFNREVVLPKFAFEQPIGTVDIYGALLSHVLLGGSYTDYLSQQWDLVKDGSKPLPIYTTVSMHATGPEGQKTYRYNWYEMNPLEVENIDLGLSIPSWAFGRKFARGMSQRVGGVASYPYEQSMGFLLGIFGSAYAIDFLKEAYTFVEGAARAIIKAVTSVVRVRRLWPAQAPNPWFELPDFITKRLFSTLGEADWLRTKKLLTFVDGGIDFNLPLLPLLKKDRALDVLIIGDASANVDQMVELNGNKYPVEFAKFLKRFDPAGQKYAPHPEHNTAPFIVYKPKQPGLPLLIYLNFIKDEKAMQAVVQAADSQALKKLIREHRLITFEPLKCVAKDYCGTFNFNYTRSEFEQLKAMGQFNVLSNAKKLLKVLLGEYVKKNLVQTRQGLPVPSKPPLPAEEVVPKPAAAAA